MFPFSPIQIVEQTSKRLVIEDPPYYLAGGVCLAVGLILASLRRLRIGEGDTPEQMGWVALLLAAPFVVAGLLLLTGSTTATLSRETGRLTIRKRYLGMVMKTREALLAEVQGVAVGTDQQSRSLSFVLHSGEEISLGSFTDRKGYYAAAEAANRFLQESRR
jgi:hypothetical protein